MTASVLHPQNLGVWVCRLRKKCLLRNLYTGEGMGTQDYINSCITSDYLHVCKREIMATSRMKTAHYFARHSVTGDAHEVLRVRRHSDRQVPHQRQ